MDKKESEYYKWQEFNIDKNRLDYSYRLNSGQIEDDWIITHEEALKLIPPKDIISVKMSIYNHCLEMEWDREEVINKILSYDKVGFTSINTSQKFNTGMAIFNTNVEYMDEVLFIETDPAQLDRLKKIKHYIEN